MGEQPGPVVVEVVGPVVLVLVFLAGLLALSAAARRAYLLARYALTRPRRVDAVDPKPGRRWLRLTGEVTVDDPLDGPTGDPDTVAYRVTAHRQERLSGVPWPSAATPLLDETTHATFALRAPGRTLRVDGGDAVDVVGPRWNEKGATYTPADPPPDPLADFLRARDADPAAKMGDGRAFDHDLRTNCTVVTASNTVRLFGRFDIRCSGTVELVPLSGSLSDACLTTGPWRTLPVRYLHELLRALLGGLLLASVAGSLLWPEVAPLVARL